MVLLLLWVTTVLEIVWIPDSRMWLVSDGESTYLFVTVHVKSCTSCSSSVDLDCNTKLFLMLVTTSDTAEFT